MDGNGSCHLNRQLVASLQSRIERELGALLPPGTRCAHVGYPDHWNTGDPAIWLGTHAVLDRLGVEVGYQGCLRSFDRAAMKERIGCGPVLIAGGGNVGDLWPNHQIFRERVIRECPENPVIQLPQSVFFDHDENQERFRRVCDEHGGVHLMVREKKSLEAVHAAFDLPTTLCPDLAFGLGVMPRPCSATCAVRWLLRTDKESREAGAPRLKEACDWVALGPDDSDDRAASVLARQRVRRLTSIIEAGDDAATRVSPRLADPFDRLALIRLRRGLRMLAEGRVVVTDRLHGHILCLCMGISHVIMDNSYGKVGSTWETWTREAAGVTWADNSEDAREAASGLEVVT